MDVTLVCLDARDGAFYGKVKAISYIFGAPSFADFDGDGVAEVSMAQYRADGSLMFQCFPGRTLRE